MIGNEENKKSLKKFIEILGNNMRNFVYSGNCC
jgi:hypothetical protein